MSLKIIVKMYADKRCLEISIIVLEDRETKCDWTKIYNFFPPFL